MSLPIEWLAGADADLQAAFDRFEDQREESGTKFLALIERYLERIGHLPEIAPSYLQRIRRQVMKQSVYGIFYVVEPTRIVIIALLDLRQDERQIRRRLLA